MGKTMRSTSLLIRLAIGTVVLVPLLFLPQATFSQDKNEPKHPKTLVPRETIVGDKDKDDKEKEEPAIPLLTCGKCPEGYVKTAVAVPRVGLELGAKFDMLEMCQGLYKSEASTVVECKPIGKQNQMPVCGACPEGYREIGRTLLPALCGNEDGGLRTQCQLPKMEGGMPDPSQGGRRCPPDCAGNLPSGLPPESLDRPGKLPPPPKAPE